MASPDLGQFTQVPFLGSTGEVIDRLRKGDTVVIRAGSNLDTYLSETDEGLPEAGRVIYTNETPINTPPQVIDIVDFSGDSVPLSQSPAA